MRAHPTSTEHGPQVVSRDRSADPLYFCIEWNAENQLTRVTKNTVEQARFKYDPQGRRVEKVAGGVTTAWTHDGQDILRQVSGASTLKYIHGPGIDEPLASDDGAGLSSFQQDGLGSVVKTASSAGVITLTRQYDAWGNAQAGATSAGYAFTGREWDPEVGLHYYRARYYEPRQGRFLSEDPIGVAGGPSFYVYANNSPAVWVDPTGLEVTTNKPDPMPPKASHKGTSIPTGLGGLALFCMENCLGSNFQISGGNECTPDGRHIPASEGGGPNSKHCTNQAFDVRADEIGRRGQRRFFCCAKQCGVKYILSEPIGAPKPVWFHFQIVPGLNPNDPGALPSDQQCSCPYR